MKVFGRLATLSIVRDKLAEARAAGGRTLLNQTAGTAIARTKDGAELFRAIQKGQGSPFWLIIYNAEFYPNR